MLDILFARPLASYAAKHHTKSWRPKQPSAKGLTLQLGVQQAGVKIVTGKSPGKFDRHNCPRS